MELRSVSKNKKLKIPAKKIKERAKESKLNAR